jgi:hypothetical protein
MKNYFLQSFCYGIAILSLYGCHCKDCPNKIEEKLSTLPYKDQNIVSFMQDGTDITDIDTVKISYKPPSGGYECNGEKEGSTVCGGEFDMHLGDYYMLMTQGFQDDNASSKTNAGFNMIYGFKCGTYHFIDNADLVIDNKTVTVRHFEVDTTDRYFLDPQSQCSSALYCREFYLTDNDKLMQYDLLRNNVLEKWILKE